MSLARRAEGMSQRGQFIHRESGGRVKRNKKEKTEAHRKEADRTHRTEKLSQERAQETQKAIRRHSPRRRT